MESQPKNAKFRNYPESFHAWNERQNLTAFYLEVVDKMKLLNFSKIQSGTIPFPLCIILYC